MPSRVSVILVNFNGWRLLDRALRALQTTRGVDFDVIVVDNLSSDGSREKIAIHHPEVRLITMDHNAGFGAANLAGVEATGAEFVAFLNNDTEVAPDWLAPLMEPLERDPEIGASCSTLLLLEEPHLLNATGAAMARVGYGYDRGFRTRYTPRDINPGSEPWEDVFAPTGASMLMRRREFLAMDGFDSAMFMYHEDVDLGWRLWLSGKRVVLCHQSIVRHHCGATTNSLRGHRWKELRGMRHCARTLLKCYEWPNALYAVGSQWRLRWKQRDFYGVLHLALWNFWNAPSLFSQRIALQKNRPFPDAAFFDKGLIDRDDFPPALHDTPGDISRPLIKRHRLHVAEHSAEANLIDGWHGPENSYGSDVRWTASKARCRLQTEPGQSGILQIRVRIPLNQLSKRQITINCNGRQTSMTVPTDWTTISLPNAEADEKGRLIVIIEANGWRPFDVDGSPDYRTLGCMVSEIVFAPETPEKAYDPQNVSVIISTFNRCGILEKTLNALAKQTHQDFEVIVVDNASTDGTPEMLEQWKSAAASRCIKIVRIPSQPPAQAWNQGVKHASGDILVLLGDDMIPLPDFIEQHLAAHEFHAQPCAVVGQIGWDTSMRISPFMKSMHDLGYHFADGENGGGRETVFTQFHGSNVSISRSLFCDTLPNPAFDSVYWADAELGYRFHLLGVPLFFCGKARTAHRHPRTITALLERQKDRGAASLRLYELHPELQYHRLTSPHAPLLPFPWDVFSRPVFLPAWSLLDGMGVQLPTALCRALLDSACHLGRVLKARAEKERD